MSRNDGAQPMALQVCTIAMISDCSLLQEEAHIQYCICVLSSVCVPNDQLVTRITFICIQMRWIYEVRVERNEAARRAVKLHDISFCCHCLLL